MAINNLQHHANPSALFHEYRRITAYYGIDLRAGDRLAVLAYVPAIAVYSIGYLVGRFAITRRHDGINYRLLYFHFALLLSVYEKKSPIQAKLMFVRHINLIN